MQKWNEISTCSLSVAFYCAASADTTVRLWHFDDSDADPALPRFGAEELLCLEVMTLTMYVMPLRTHGQLSTTVPA